MKKIILIFMMLIISAYSALGASTLIYNVTFDNPLDVANLGGGCAVSGGELACSGGGSTASIVHKGINLSSNGGESMTYEMMVKFNTSWFDNRRGFILNAHNSTTNLNTNWDIGSGTDPNIAVRGSSNLNVMLNSKDHFNLLKITTNANQTIDISVNGTFIGTIAGFQPGFGSNGTFIKVNLDDTGGIYIDWIAHYNTSETQTIEADTSNPNFANELINDSTPAQNEDVNISVEVNDDTALLSYMFATNITGFLDNGSSNAISGTQAQIDEQFTVNLTKGNVIAYQWYVEDSSGNSNQTSIQTFTVANTPPSPAVILYPTAALKTNQIPIDLNVTFPSDIDGDSLTINYYINGTLNATSLNNATLSISDGNYILEVELNDGMDSSNNISVEFEVDITNPILTITLPSISQQFINDSNITTSITCTDLNPFILNFSIYNSSSDLIQTEQNDTPQSTELSLSRNIGITELPLGTYTLNTSCSDSHTARSIPQYEATLDNADKSINYKVQNLNEITIKVLGSQKLNVAGFSTKKMKDRYTWQYDFNNVEDGTIYIYEFLILAKGTDIRYLPDSDYHAHFVTDENWIDFEFAGNEKAIYTVTRIGRNYKVQIKTEKSSLKFSSIGGLNIVKDSRAFSVIEAPDTSPQTSQILNKIAPAAIIMVLLLVTLVGIKADLQKFARGGK